MKKCLLTIMTLLFITSSFSYANEFTHIQIEVNGKLVNFENPPLVREGRTMAPLRAIFEELGLEVSWNGQDSSIVGKADDLEIWLQLNNNLAQVNKKETRLEVAAFAFEGRTYVPVRFISESTGADVEWKGEEQKVIITSKTLDLHLEKIDSDSDGLSDYQEIHKYRTDPHNSDTDSDGLLDNDWNERKEHTYTLTAKMQVMKPFNSSQMNDNYQDIKVISETEDTLVFEVVVYPFNSNKGTVRANSNWKNDYIGMKELKSTVTANWDEALKEQIIKDLKESGIDYSQIETDKELIETVAPWIWKNSEVVNGPGAPIQALFDYETMALNPKFKGTSLYKDFLFEDWSEKEILAYLALGKEMYSNKTHGACSSSSVYQTTILRALGIPTRITYQVPLYNGEKPDQRELLKNINNREVREALEKMFVGIGDHFYNEVYVGNQWVRLNYSDLGANIYDPSNPMAILINLGYENDFADFNMDETWASYIVYNRSVEASKRKDFIKLIEIYDEDNR